MIIEKVIYDYLSSQLTVPVYMEMPNVPNPSDEPERFVVVEKTGSSLTNRLYQSTVAVQSYADSLYEAAMLNDEVKTVMLNAIVLAQVTRVAVNSDYSFTDESTKRYRYQAVFDITHY